MTRNKKWIIFILILLLVAVGAELVREKVAYFGITRKLADNYWSLDKQRARKLTREQVRQLAGEPEQVRREGNEEYWYWYASNHRGALWKLLPAWGKPYTLYVVFDKDGRMQDVYSTAE
jgi:outer membrane protein assembly factor BamE (lipoprotein component of BamABCDE complex)